PAGLLLDGNDASALECRHAESLGVGHLLENDPGPAWLSTETLHRRRDGALDHVVAQDDAELVAIGEVLRQRERGGDPALAFLIGVVEMLQAELLPVAEQAKEVAGVLTAGDDQ